MQLGIEKRFSPRVTTNSSIKVVPGNIQCNLLNISETGVCFECEGDELSGDISLSTDILPSKSKKSTEISAKVVRKTTLPNNRIQQNR